jgi:hypothetical protein
MKFFVSFFIEQLHLVRLDMPRKDLQFCLIFVELFVFLIDSPMYLLFHNRGLRLPSVNTPIELTKIGLQNTYWCQILKIPLL